MAKLNNLRVLVACECSQTVCAEFRKLGVECYSCDIQQEYGGISGMAHSAKRS